MTPATLDAPPRTKDSTTVTLTIARQALKTALTRLSGSVGSGLKALPVTHQVRLDVTPGQLTLTATDFESWARITLPCEADMAMTALLPAKRLADIVTALPPVGAVTLKLTGTNAVLSTGRTRFELVGLPVAEFPDDLRVTTTARTTVNAAAFLDTLGRVASHVATAESRISLNAVLFEPSDATTLCLVATCGFHLARLPLAVTGDALPTCSLWRLAVPVLARLFSGLPDDATLALAVDGSRFLVEGGGATAIVRLLDDPFPPYRHVLDVAPQRTVVCDAVLLAAAIRRVALVSDETNRVEFDLGDEIGLRAVGADVGKAADVVAIDEERGEGREPVTFALNASYVLSALDTLTVPAVAITVDKPERAILLRPAETTEHVLTLVMPLRIL